MAARWLPNFGLAVVTEKPARELPRSVDLESAFSLLGSPVSDAMRPKKSGIFDIDQDPGIDFPVNINPAAALDPALAFKPA